MYAGKSLAEIAGYDDTLLHWVIGRKRDKLGRLVRRGGELPEGVEVDEDGMRIVTNPVPYGMMFRQVHKLHGFDDPEIEKRWQEWRAKNPRFGRGGD